MADSVSIFREQSGLERNVISTIQYQDPIERASKDLALLDNLAGAVTAFALHLPRGYRQRKERNLGQRTSDVCSLATGARVGYLSLLHHGSELASDHPIA